MKGAALHHPECGVHLKPGTCNCGRSNARSARREVRNPILGLSAFARLCELDPKQREIIAAILRELAADAKTRAEKSWRTNKGPMAAYWKAASVYAKHIAAALRRHH